MGISRGSVLLAVGMLVTGSLNTISKKMAYDTCAVGIDPPPPDSHNATCSKTFVCEEKDEKLFKFPWTFTLVMFCGEATCFLYFLAKKRGCCGGGKRDDGMMPLLGDVDDIGDLSYDDMKSPVANFKSPTLARRGSSLARAKSPTWRDAVICAIPACCDLLGTTISAIGLLLTTASVWQMLRGSIILFTATLSIFFLGKKQRPQQWTGIAITIVGVTLVGTSSMIGSHSSKLPAGCGGNEDAISSASAGHAMLGNVLVVASQLLSATQMVIEEKFLKHRKLPPEFVVGCEGFFGAIVMGAVVLPILYHITGSQHENAFDAAKMFASNARLAVLVLLYFASIAFYNFFGLAVAKKLSSVHRTLIDAMRTVFVWIVDVILFQTSATDSAGHHQYGEAFVNPGSIIQLGGFAVMLAGTIIYNNIVKVPCGRYDEE